MRSSYSGFGHSSLTNDVEDMAALVRYLRRIGKERVVFMGASTGINPLLVRIGPELTNLRLPGLPRVHQQGQVPKPSRGRIYLAKPRLGSRVSLSVHVASGVGKDGRSSKGDD